MSAPAPPVTIPAPHRVGRRRSSSAVTVADLLTLPAWDVPGLRALVDAEPRPCQMVDPELHQPDPPAEVGPTAAQTRQARAVCGACPVRAACAALAMTGVLVSVDGRPVVEPYAAGGIWGGLDPDQRRELAREWRALTALAGSPQPARFTRCHYCGQALASATSPRPARETCSPGCRRALAESRARRGRAESGPWSARPAPTAGPAALARPA